MNTRNVHATDHLSASALSALLHRHITAKYKSGLFVASIFLTTISLHATVLTVTSLADSGSGSLRDTIAASSAGDAIQFAVNGKIVLSSAININHSLFLQGPGAALLTVDANHVDRAFVTSGNSTNTISGMTITNGYVAGANGADGGIGQNGSDGGSAYGGAIYDGGNWLIVSNCWLVGNTVEGGQGGRGGPNVIGATYFRPGNGGGGGLGEGGAVYATSFIRVDIFNCTFSHNRAVGGVGGKGGTNVASSLDTGGTGGQGGGGQAGALQSTSAFLTYCVNCTFSANRTGGGQGGEGGDNTDNGTGGTGGTGGGGGGGAIATPNALSLTFCTIVSNLALAGAGGPGGSGGTTGANGNSGGGTAGGIIGYTLTCNNPICSTILADNFASTSCSNYFMALRDDGNNFIGSDDYSSCPWGPTSQVGTIPAPIHPQLGPLAQNGGGMPTHATTLTSPAIDAGSSECFLGLMTDERGAPRTFDFASVPNTFGSDGTDIGAFELGSADLGLDVVSNNVVVSWPAYYGDFSLQSATNLQGPSNWNTVCNSPVLIGNQFVITNRVTNAAEFFRLINQ